MPPLLPEPKCLDSRSCLEWLKTDRPIPWGGSFLPEWLTYHESKNSLESSQGPQPENSGLYTVRFFGSGEVVLEEIKLQVSGQGGHGFEMVNLS